MPEPISTTWVLPDGQPDYKQPQELSAIHAWRERLQSSFDAWFQRHFHGYWIPDARGGYTEVHDPEGAHAAPVRDGVQTTCLECGAAVLMATHQQGGDDLPKFDPTHLNRHRSWHDKINNG